MEEDFRRDVTEAAIKKLQADAAREAVESANKFIPGDAGKATAEKILDRAAGSAQAAEEARRMESQRIADARYQESLNRAKQARSGS